LGRRGTPTNDGKADLPVCPNLTVGKRSDAGGTMAIRTQEHGFVRSGGSLGGASAYVSLQRDKAAPAHLGGVKLYPAGYRTNKCLANMQRLW
jgi:hypothetical protein